MNRDKDKIQMPGDRWENLQNSVNQTKAVSEGLFEITIPAWVNSGFTPEEVQAALDGAGVSMDVTEILNRAQLEE